MNWSAANNRVERPVCRHIARHFSKYFTGHSWHRQLDEQSTGEHCGYGEKTLGHSCDDLQFVHDAFSELN